MRERLSALKGEMTLNDRPGGGTRLQAVIPHAAVVDAVA